MTSGFDVIVVGEVLVELSGAAPLGCGDDLKLGFAGDALNAAAAAAAAGASVALLSVVGDDELGEALLARAVQLGIDVSLVRRSVRPNGVYFVSAAEGHAGEFIYSRRGSAGSSLHPSDVDRAGYVLGASGALHVTGITGALSRTACAALLAAVARMADAHRVVTYDPNYRSKLTTAAAARRLLADVAPMAALVTPSAPEESRALLRTDDPEEAASRTLLLGAQAVCVTHGPEQVLFADRTRRMWLGVPPNDCVVDPTGGGDVLCGTAVARLALGDDLLDAVALGVTASSLSVSGSGGTGRIPMLEETRMWLERQRYLVIGDRSLT